jgi:hypothetical protein
MYYTLLFCNTELEYTCKYTAGMNKLKVVNASQGCIHQYEKLKRKLLFCYTELE